MKIEANVDKLPKQGSLRRTPWAASYYPMYRDGANVQWAGEGTDSAVTKYAKAFNFPDAKALEDAASLTSGIDWTGHRQVCRSDSECGLDSCAKRVGQDVGRCVPGWEGLCHAWAPAALIEPEPMCPVEYNGVKFEVNDLKALLLLTYQNTGVTGSVMFGTRCNEMDIKNKDIFGRPTVAECLDMNAGTFHLITTNMIGVYKRGYVGDLTATAQVWNFPVYTYDIIDQQDFNPSEAMKKFYPNTVDKYPFNSATVQVQYNRVQIRYVVESSLDDNYSWTKEGMLDRFTRSKTYTYIVELDERRNVIGGEWVGSTLEDHPDFLWIPMNKAPKTVEVCKIRYRHQDGSIKMRGISYATVKELLNRSISSSC